MRTVTRERERHAPPETPPPMVHIWKKPHWRHPMPGDRSLCGLVKENPYSGKYGRGSVTCVVCAALRAEHDR